MYVRPTVDGKPTTLGVSGKLWRDSLVMYDRATNSLWSQVLGKAVAGPLEGQRLTQIPSEITTWGEWKSRHPDTLVLVKPRLSGSVYDDYHQDAGKIGVLGRRNPDNRLGAKALVYGFEKDGRHAAVPLSLLETKPVLNAEAFGIPIVIFSPPGENAAMVFERTVGGKVLIFSREEGGRLTVRDEESGSTWSWETGRCVQGPFEGQSLQRLPGVVVYWGVWAQFHPETELIISGF